MIVERGEIVSHVEERRGQREKKEGRNQKKEMAWEEKQENNIGNST